jgi:Xaa-Pro aminopeptidase
MSEILNPTDSGEVSRLAKLRGHMFEQKIDAVVLTYAHYIAAVFDGAQVFNCTRPEPPGRAAIIITNNHLYVLANRTECTRISQEELAAFAEVVPQPVDWHEWKLQKNVNEWMSKQSLRHWWADSFGPNASEYQELLESLLYPLNEIEMQRITALGHLVAETLVKAAKSLEPKISELTVAAWIHQRLLQAGALPDLVFVAFDERMSRFRHCKPGPAELKKNALLSITACKQGLFVSASRIVSIAPATEKLKEDTRIANNIEAAAIWASQPGITSGEVFEAMRAAYEKYGSPNGWREHHLGGPSGFRGRDAKVTPGEKYILKAGQPFVYNPVWGAGKSEDTFIRLADPGKLLCLTKDSLWPINRVETPGAQTFERPGVLEINAK